MTHPHLAVRDCTHCLAFVYDERTGRPVEYPAGSGQWMPRPAGTASLCQTPGLGCPKGTPTSPRSLTAANQQAYQFDCECRAVGHYPDDPLVRRHALLIRTAESTP
ncbi:MAG: hypothetical protein JSS02_27160 [Planctomycetes bacterium]|nr:hypothetical protein [Planctomycetota bacterium]